MFRRKKIKVNVFFSYLVKRNNIYNDIGNGIKKFSVTFLRKMGSKKQYD